MTTKIRISLIVGVCLIVGMNITAMYIDNQNQRARISRERDYYAFNIPEASEAPEVSEVSEVPKASELPEECPVCLESKNVIKPFKCDHGLCPDCFSGMRRAHAQGAQDNVNLGFIQVPVNYPVNLVCPLCRAELK